jgi:hypothetical protein
MHIYKKEINMEKTTLKPYDKNVAKQKRIKELQENIVLYTCELRRFKEELIKLQNQEVA